jgi:hypothetical protein
MTLIADTNTKGLWLPEAPRKAGAHALIIGVSDYPHLAGGSGPLADDNGGLSQLEVSAKTGAKVFRWLDQVGEVAGAPVATCRLLLSPRPSEIAEIDQVTRGNYGPSNFDSVRKAIEDWGNDIFAGATEPGANVALFFFSGHGTEHMASPALLARDILNPRVPGGARKAIALRSICDAIKTFGIDRALFFVDACRDVPNVARTLNIIGEDILSPYAYPPRNHDALICLQSTRAGGSAYQVAGDPATIFGQAVIDALDGPPPSYRPYDTSVVPWRLVFKELERHVKEEVRNLLRRQTAALIQSVVPYGDPYDGDMLVAQRQGPLPGMPPPLIVPASAPLASVLAARSADIMMGFSPPVIPGLVPHALADFPIMHDIFRHEGVTDPWIHTLRILDVETGEPLPDAVRLAEGRSQEVGQTLTAWLDVLVPPGEGRALWIGAGGENNSPSFAVVIPRDLMVPTPVRLDLTFESEHTGPDAWTMTGMTARLHDPAQLAGDVQHVWADLWEVQRTETLSDLSHAGMVARDRAVLEKALANKLRSPVAAAIAATVLIRCGTLEQLQEWPRTLADAFPWLPDGAVLWAETLLQYDDLANRRTLAAHPHIIAPGQKLPLRDDAAEIRRLVAKPAYEEARRYFARLADCSPTLLAGTLAMAVRQEKFFRRAIEIDAVTGQARQDLQDACEVARNAADYAVSDGLFAAFASRAGQMSPLRVLRKRGHRARATAE